MIKFKHKMDDMPSFGVTMISEVPSNSQLILNKSSNFHDFFSLLFEKVFYSNQSFASDFTDCMYRVNKEIKKNGIKIFLYILRT